MTTLDTKLLQQVKQALAKQAFVPMPGGQAEPVAGAGPMTAGMVAPMGDPGMEGMPMDPGMGGMPMDPGMMPPPGLDPAMTGMMGGMPPGGEMTPPEGGAEGGTPNGTITLTINDLIKLIKVFNAGGAQEAAQPQQAASDPKLDEIIALLKGSLG